VQEPLLSQLVASSSGFAGSDLEAAVKEVGKHAILKGDAAVTDEVWTNSFQNIVPLSKTSPERIASIRAWGRDRAVPASGVVSVAPTDGRSRRGVLN
jgi:hypothetical protein